MDGMLYEIPVIPAYEPDMGTGEIIALLTDYSRLELELTERIESCVDLAELELLAEAFDLLQVRMLTATQDNPGMAA